MKKNNILLIGPMPKPINGVSICNELIVNKLDSFNVEVIDTANKSFNEQLGKFNMQKLWSGIKTYFKIHKMKNADIVYMTIGQTFFGILKYYPFFIFSSILNKEIVIHIHGNYLRKQYHELKGLKKKLINHILKKANKGIVLSENLVPNLSPFIDRKNIYVLYNFVTKELENLSSQSILQKNTDKLKIVFLSNLMTEKGIFDLLYALKILEQKRIPFTVKIAGNIDASIKEEVIELIHSIKGAKYIGVVRGKEKTSLLLEANTFVFPTYYQMEGQPISLLEAMAAGNIVLTTKHAGIPDIFSENNGYYIEKKSPKDIADKLIEVSNNLNKLSPMMMHNSEYVKNNYTENIFLNNLSKIFKQ